MVVSTVEEIGGRDCEAAEDSQSERERQSDSWLDHIAGAMGNCKRARTP